MLTTTGGTDGIAIEEGASAAAVTIQEITIEMAQNCGIFSTPAFFLNNCKVHSLGRYSIEGLLGTMISSLAIRYRQTNIAIVYNCFLATYYTMMPTEQQFYIRLVS